MAATNESPRTARQMIEQQIARLQQAVDDMAESVTFAEAALQRAHANRDLAVAEHAAMVEVLRIYDADVAEMKAEHGA